MEVKVSLTTKLSILIPKMLPTVMLSSNQTTCVRLEELFRLSLSTEKGMGFSKLCYCNDVLMTSICDIKSVPPRCWLNVAMKCNGAFRQNVRWPSVKK